MTSDGTNVSVVIPVYRSGRSLPELIVRLSKILDSFGGTNEIILVDDSSPDDTWSVLQDLKAQRPSLLRIVRLARNSGQHNAILCGFSMARGDIVVTMDDDLQNPPEEIPNLLAPIRKGYDLAIGAYDSKKHSGVRNAGGGMIDALLRRMYALPPDFQLTSFRAIRNTVVRSVCGMGGSFPYVTAMLLANTSKCLNVPVRHDVRKYGNSNYNLRRSFRLAANLIFSYTSYPLYAIAAMSALAFLFAAVFGTFVLISAVLSGTSVAGWASTIVIISFFQGLLLFCMAILALYVSRINRQITRNRQTYAIGEIVD